MLCHKDLLIRSQKKRILKLNGYSANATSCDSFTQPLIKFNCCSYAGYDCGLRFSNLCCSIFFTLSLKLFRLEQPERRNESTSTDQAQLDGQNIMEIFCPCGIFVKKLTMDPNFFQLGDPRQ